MSFHDKRIQSASIGKKSARRQLMLRGARKINLWQRLPAPVLGTTADDWAEVGSDVRTAMRQHALSE